MKQLLAILSLTVALFSCRGKTECKNEQFGFAFFTARDTTIGISDTSVTIFRYSKSGYFSQSDTVFDCRIMNSIHNKKHYGIWGSDMVGKLFTLNDWKLVAHPSEKIYYIKNTHFVSRKKPALYNSYQCANDYGYTINGADITVSGDGIGTSRFTYLYFDY